MLMLQKKSKKKKKDSLFTCSTNISLPNSIIACSRTLSPGIACCAATHLLQLKARVPFPAPLFSPHSTSQTAERGKKVSLFCHITLLVAIDNSSFYFTLLSFSCSLVAFMLISSMASSLRTIGERWEVSVVEGVMWYCTLGVHLTEKNLDPGGAPLWNANMQ